MSDKEIDLQPHEYRSEPRPEEPFFGSGWPFGLAVAISILTAAIFHGSSGPIWGIGVLLGALITVVLHQFWR